MSHEPAYRCPSTWRWIGKLTPPKTLLTSVARETLMADLRSHHQVPLQLLVAPAGYGKTTLMMQGFHWGIYLDWPPPRRLIPSHTEQSQRLLMHWRKHTGR